MEVSRKVDVEELRELLYIDDDWLLRWRVNRSTKKSGDIAGGLDSFGYLIVSVNHLNFKCHRIIWALFYGVWPTGQLDHINGIKDDNCIENLREVTSIENARNQKLFKNNKSKLPGVVWHKGANKWQATITVNYQQIYLGLYEDFFEVVCARKSAELRHGYHINHGRS